MNGSSWERWGRAAGAGFAVVAAAAFLVAGEQPKVADPTADVVAYYDGDRGKVLAASYLFVLALLLLLWFAATIANLLRERGEGRVGTTVVAAATAFVALQIAMTATGAALAYSVAGDGDEGVVKALFDLSLILDVLAALPGAVFVLTAAVGLRRIGAVPSWLGWTGVAVALLFLLRSTNWARDGFWSPSGDYLFVLVPLGLAWILVVSVALARAATTALREVSTA